MFTSGNISEVFLSPQGEGEYVGFRQLFVRLCGCPYDCPYCDTDVEIKPFFELEGKNYDNPVNVKVFTDLLLQHFGNGSRFHSYSFTGGEPLISKDFVFEAASILQEKSKAKLFLETSGLMTDAIKECDGIFDIISADIKTHSEKVLNNMPKLFMALSSLRNTSYYLKLLWDENNHDGLLERVTNNMKDFDMKKIIVQPVDNNISEDSSSKIFETFYFSGIEARIIPQTHKMLSLR